MYVFLHLAEKLIPVKLFFCRESNSLQDYLQRFESDSKRYCRKKRDYN